MADDPVVDGVPLSAFAAVRAFTVEGIPLETSLAHVGIASQSWPAVEAAWEGRLAKGEATDDRGLADAYAEHLTAARAQVIRPLPPLDEDLRAWLDFMCAFGAGGDALGFLAARGMTESDVFRLLSIWKERLKDEAVRKQYDEIAGSPPGPAPEVRPEPPRLDPSKAAAAPPLVAAPPAAPADVPAPEAQPTPPPFSMPLPVPEAATSQTVIPPPNLQPPPPSVVPPASSSAPPPDTRLMLMSYASMVAEIAVAPEQKESVFAKYGLSDPALRDTERRAWRARLEANPEEFEEWEKSYQHFYQHFASLRARRTS
jgi:hypothetical protein